MKVSEPSILYVDDDEGNRVVFRHTFQDEFPLVMVSSGAEALDVLRETEPEIGVVVSDQRMPGLTGNELLRLVKDQYPGVVRMIITAYSDLDAILGAVNRGLVSRYIVKPWDAEEVREILRWGLDAYTLGLRSEALQARLLEVERVATVGTVASAILHDVNGPLGYLSLNADRLRSLAEDATPRLSERVADGRDPELAEAVQPLIDELPEIAAEIGHGCQTLLETVMEVRRLLYAESRGPQRTEPIPAIRYALSVTREVASETRTRVTYDGPDTLPPVTMGFASLVRVLINLISNAAQAIGSSEAPGQVSVDARLDGRHVSLRVRDDGPGMPSAVARRVGTPLFTTRPHGTGLGVSQCLRLVASAGGEMSIDSVEGSGTTVALRIPVAPDGRR